jgi:ATP-dependent 26S proteasome regulatory subunit
MPLSANEDHNLRHLQAQMARIDVLVRRQVLLWQHAGQDPAEAFRGLHVSDAKARLLSGQAFGSSLGDGKALSPEETRSLILAYEQANDEALAIQKDANDQGRLLRLQYLSSAFGLDAFDLDTLLICLAPALDLRYERLYAYLQDDVTRKRASVNLVLDLLCDDDVPERLAALLRFGDDSSLFRAHFLIRASEQGPTSPPLLSQALAVDEALITWLLGGFRPHAELGDHASAEWPAATEGEQNALLVLVGEARAALDQTLGLQSADQVPVVVLQGADQAGQDAAARYLAAKSSLPLLRVDLAAVVGSGVDARRAVELSLRDALLTGSVACLTGWDVCLAPDGTVHPSMLTLLCNHPAPVIVAARARWQLTGIDRQRVFLWIELPIPGHEQRLALWRHFLQRAGMDSGMDLSLLAGQFLLTAGQIRDAVATIQDTAARSGLPMSAADLFAAARFHSSPALSSLARKITPRFQWDDIVLPQDQVSILHEIVSTVRERPLVMDTWGVGRKLASSNGVTILFAGPPGTGKTMAAEVIATELGLDLYKIDLSTIVSKYIGETEKNLERIFGEAQSSNAILFFDEADAIFGKRSEVKDAHDRYANIEVSYLLQRMEAYDGVTILATNLRANLDDAFTRRLQHAVDFPFPEEEYRLRIWQTLFPPDVPRQPDLDFAPLARRFKLAGGNIRNIIVGAAFLAAADGGSVTMDHLLHGARREMQKMGRLMNEASIPAG